ncbi:uncharacterized protein LOC119671856 [Teleopsis dalmanni]|uniref:uncharacterized protein LOC119671856 n=1 Tax=Teleopsis dalmanni TaxID=139649 RepID=UPI0018CE4C46|nr:uncharacterized protein LOC119671856 [Teleopsis dalmanni]
MEDEALNLSLINLVRKYECLYNPDHNNYMKKSKIDAAWNIISNKLNKPTGWCRAKWKNIRTVYSRHIREEVLGGVNKKRKYYLSEAMDFIVPYTKFSRQTENYISDIVKNETIEYLNSDEIPFSDSSNYFQETNFSIQKLHEQAVSEDIDNCQNNRNDDNGFQSFFMGILPDISPLNAKRKRFLKMKILELINELNEEQESEEHFISYESEESL